MNRKLPTIIKQAILGTPVSFNMILVEDGPFVIGEGANTKALTLPDYYLAEFPVTQELWKAVMKGEEHPSYFQGAQRPKTNVSWHDIKNDFLPALQILTGKTFRLPSIAEWEYAALGGKHSEGFEYAGSNHLDEVGWYHENSYYETKPVGLKLPNELGLYDMSGNVWEWCEDYLHNSWENSPNDSSAWKYSPKRGDLYVRRGGSYFDYSGLCFAAGRNDWHSGDRSDSIGFRLALSPQFSP